ncbi:CAP domain-containing protein [Virgibacillus necropolis]|uniref:CAP domain-containing protein n=1 Tax=Virgibacillus necropolis TaxID=163877 RepID=UPI00384CE508
MRLKWLFISIISLLLLLLVACNNNNENALDPSNQENINTDDTSSSIYIGAPSDGEYTDTQENYDYNLSQEDNDEPLQKQTNDDNDSQPLSPEGISDFEAAVIELTNAERKKAGLSELQPDTRLSRVANLKSKEMVVKDYFSHESPSYGSPSEMMNEFGVSYQTDGENIAYGQKTPEQVVNQWMDSAGHRKNILNNDFTHIGVGFVKDGYYWTQMFIEK